MPLSLHILGNYPRLLSTTILDYLRQLSKTNFIGKIKDIYDTAITTTTKSMGFDINYLRLS